MPENASRLNGYVNGNGVAHHHNGFESEDGQTFLFTSESVGEGHPGKTKSKIPHFFSIFRIFFPIVCTPIPQHIFSPKKESMTSPIENPPKTTSTFYTSRMR